MKKIIYIIIAFLLFSTPVMAQDLGDILNAAKDAFGGAQQKAENEAEATQKFKEAFNNKLKKWKDFSNNLDQYSPQTKCLYIMAKYILEFEELKKQTDATSDCKKKYDLYGMQQMTLMSSTSVMFCTEEMYEKTNLFAMMLSHDNGGNVTLPEDVSVEKDLLPYFQPIKEELSGIGNDIDSGNQERKITDFEKTMYKFYGLYHILSYNSESGFGIDILAIHKLLEAYFHPLALAKDAIAISKKMDALKPCAER